MLAKLLIVVGVLNNRIPRTARGILLSDPTKEYVVAVVWLKNQSEAKDIPNPSTPLKVAAKTNHGLAKAGSFIAPGISPKYQARRNISGSDSNDCLDLVHDRPQVQGIESSEAAVEQLVDIPFACEDERVPADGDDVRQVFQDRDHGHTHQLQGNEARPEHPHKDEVHGKPHLYDFEREWFCLDHSRPFGYQYECEAHRGLVEQQCVGCVEIVGGEDELVHQHHPCGCAAVGSSGH
eukprot:scaffold116_cov334-Pavlova_lutheri.AAC.27